MSKIVQAVNAMISNPELISRVILGSAQGVAEYFFLYKDSYKWSIAEIKGDVKLWYYPGDVDLEILASLDDFQEGPSMVYYSAETIGTKEARASFAELLAIVKENLYGINDVLDDIIAGGPPF